jgi:hypothetical protein
MLLMFNTAYFCSSGVLFEVQFVCSNQYVCFFNSLDFALSRHVVLVFSEPIFQTVPFAPIITGMPFIFIFRIFCVAIVRSLCFRIFHLLSSSHFCLQKLQDQLGYIFLFSLSRIMISGLLLWTVLSVYTIDSIICLPSYY